MSPRTKPGVFCIEGDWSSRLDDRSSVRPLLEVLEQREIIRFSHRTAPNIPTLETYLKKWTQKGNQKYGIGYFAFHGSSGALSVGGRKYTLDDLASSMAGRLTGKTLYFGSCATLDVTKKAAERFRATTNARAVCGYTEDVDWIESAAFDLNLIQVLSDYQRIDAAFKHLRTYHAGAWRALGFRAAWSGGSIWR